MNIIIWILLIICILYLFLIIPRIPPRPMHEFKKHYYAHRGFHDNQTDAPENSKKAFRLAVENGYGIELDVRLTKDEQVVVFHDDDLKRMCGVDAQVNAKTYEELKQLSLLESQEKIPLLSEVLALVDGRVPLIVEIKMVDNHTRVCELADKVLKNYRGTYCMESFHPLAVKWYRKFRPDICRGQLSSNFSSKGRWEGFALSVIHYLLTNVYTRPDFIAYSHINAGNVSRRLCRLFGATSFAWTIRTKEELERSRKKFDLFIFEGFRVE